MEKDLVSIIVPAYNQGNFLKETLSAVLNQKYSHWECIIVNDGSADNTAKVAAEFEKKDKRFTLYSTENQGVAKARNFGIEKAHGTFVLPLDGDDLISRDYLAEAISAFQNDPTLTLVYCNAHFFGSLSQKWELGTYSYKGLLIANQIFCSAVFKKADFNRTMGYDSHVVEGLEDWELWIQLLQNDAKVLKLPGTHFFYRIQAQKTMTRSGNIKPETELELRRKIYEKHIEKYQQLLPHYAIVYEYNLLRGNLDSSRFLLRQLWTQIKTKLRIS